MSINDEEWAVISSSSDIDDEQSTTSSSNGEGDCIIDDNEDPIVAGATISAQDDSISTLKLPPSKHINDDKIDEVSSIDTPDEGSESEELLSNSLESSPIISKIRFFENLSSFNKSIKQKSNKFYDNLTGMKLNQFSYYTEDDNIPQIDPITKGHSNRDNSKPDNFYSATWGQCSKYIHSLLSEHSDYLYYYGIVLSLIIGYISYHSLSKFTFMQQQTYLQKYDQNNHNHHQVPKILESLIYQDENLLTTKYYFWKHVETVKINRFTRYNQLVSNKVHYAMKQSQDWIQSTNTFQFMNSRWLKTFENLKLMGLKTSTILKVFGLQLFDNVWFNGLKVIENLKTNGLKGIDNIKVYGKNWQNMFKRNISMITHDIAHIDKSQIVYKIGQYEKSWLNSISHYNRVTNAKVHRFFQTLNPKFINSFCERFQGWVSSSKKLVGNRLPDSWMLAHPISWKTWFRFNSNQMNSTASSFTNFFKPQVNVFKIKHDFDRIAVNIYFKMNEIWNYVAAI